MLRRCREVVEQNCKRIVRPIVFLAEKSKLGAAATPAQSPAATVRGAGLLSWICALTLLDLRGLLFELGCESLYLFLLLRDRCLQLLNFAIEHGLALVAHGGYVRRCGALRCTGALPPWSRAKIPAKVVVRKV